MTHDTDHISLAAVLKAMEETGFWYTQLADVIRAIPAAPVSVDAPKAGEGKIGGRLTAVQWSAITAHFSYECEPRTPLPNWNTVAMEAIHLSNKLRKAEEQLAALDVQPAPDVSKVLAQARTDAVTLGAGWIRVTPEGTLQLIDPSVVQLMPAPDVAQIRAKVAQAIFDPGATEGYKGDRSLTDWQVDAVMRVIDTPPPPDAMKGDE